MESKTENLPPLKNSATLILHKHRHLVLKTFIWVIGIIILIPILFIVVINILGVIYKDTGETSDSDLQLPIVTVPDNQNAYFDMQKIASESSGSTTNKSSILETLTLASQKSTYQDPLTANAANLTLESVSPLVGSYRIAVNMSNSEALQLASSSNPSAGFTQALIGVDIGSKIEHSQEGLPELLTGIAMKKSSLLTIQTIATSTTQSSQNLIATAQKLESLKDDSSGLIKSYKIQYLAYTNSIIQRFANVRVNFYWHPNETRNYSISSAHQIIQIAEEPCSKFESNDAQIKTYLPSSYILWPFTPNLIGKMMHDVGDVPTTGAIQKECDDNMLIGATQIMLALQAYKRDHQILPTSLDVLVPKYLTNLPLDPYSGESFKYNATHEFIYSLGENHKDVGGNPDTDWSKAENPTFSL